MAIEKTKKKHHYLPRFYLEGFVDLKSSCLWVYEKGNLKIRSSSAINEGCQKFYHAFLTDDGNRDTNTIENYFQKIETNTANLFDNIHRREKFTDQNKKELALFFAFLITRVPLFRNELEKMAAIHINHVGLNNAKSDFKASLETFKTLFGIELNISEDDLMDLPSNRGSVLSLVHIFSIALNNFFPKLLNLKWRFLFSKQDLKWVTSDNPVYFYSASARGTIARDDFVNDDIEITIPLSKEVLLLATRRDIQTCYGDAQKQTIKNINRASVISAEKKIYSHIKSDSLNNLVQKHQNDRPYMVLSHAKHY
jgi:hypothetical protein